MSDSKETTFRDLVAINALALSDGYRAKLDELGGNGPLFLRAGALTDQGFTWKDLDAFHADRAEALSGKMGRRGDVVITTKGNSIGRTGWVPADAPSFVYSPHLSFWRARNANVLHSRFLYYWSASREFAQQLQTLGHGTDMAPYLSLRDQLRLKISLPDLKEQVAVAAVLGALDDKIAANTKLAEITDDLVRAEYNALSEDASEARSIASIGTHPRDLVDPSQADGNRIYVGLEHVPRRRMWLSESGLSSDVTSTKASFASGDVLFGKLRPYFHKVVSAPADGICSTDILVLRAKHPGQAGFLLAAAASDATVERCTAASEGTRMPRTSWKDLAAIEVPWPGDTAAQTFSARVTALRDRVDSAMVENRMLAGTRDALLPQLVSGKIRVKDAERVVEGVV